LLRSDDDLAGRRRLLGLLAVAAAAAALAWPLQGVGSVQNAHHALVRALASGTAVVDDALGEVGEVGTNDLVVIDGRSYSNKPPGLALLALPAFLALDATGLADDPGRTVWALGLLWAVLPAVGLALLVRYLGDRLEPGFGTVAAVALMLGTLLLPYATLFLNHSLSAFLVFAAFTLLWWERQRREASGSEPLTRPSLLALGLAGCVVGVASVVEYTSALAAVVLGAYTASRRPHASRLAAWAAGVAIGVAPLLVYNLLAFGSPFRTSYDLENRGDAVNLFGAPSIDVALELLLSEHGLLVISPVLVLGLAGLLLLFRSGHRAEALTAVGVVASYVAFNSAFYSPFGGFSPGPRYLVPTLPFLALGVAAAYRRLPLVTGSVTVVSIAAMAGLTATHPQAGWDGRWLDRLADGEVSQTAASLFGVTGWYAILPFFAAVAAAAILAALATPPVRVRAYEPLLAGGAVLAWAAAALSAPESGRTGDYASYLPAVVLVLAAAVAAAGPRLSRAPHLRGRTVAP
jgi:hypothetical protein